MEDRGKLSRQGQEQGCRARSTSSATNAAPSPNIGSRCKGRNSSGSACIGDWDHPYLTMSFAAEAQIAREIMKFAANGTLYRGSKPVMWSVVEKTALAEAEVEYEDHVSDTVYVAFPVKGRTARERFRPWDRSRHPAAAADQTSQLGTWPSYENVTVVIWTTTPWTLPANRAISFISKITYGFMSSVPMRRRQLGKAGPKICCCRQSRGRCVQGCAS